MTASKQNRWNVRVLLVEPAGTSSLARSILEQCVAEVVTASSIEAASAIVSSEWVDLVVLDLDLDPSNAFAWIAATAAAGPVPAFIVMSDEIPASEAFRLAQLGVRVLVRKPIEADDRLCGAIRIALEVPPDFTPYLRAAVGFHPIHEIERTARRTMMREALARSRGNKTGAAKLLCVSRQLFQHMIRGQKRLS